MYKTNSRLKKAYDSTVTFERIDCKIAPASMIEQELYFAQRSPYFKGYVDSDTLLRVFISDKQTPVNSIVDDDTKEAIKKNQPFSYSDVSIERSKLRGDLKWSDDL